MRFILVDKIVDLDPGKSIIALKTIPSTEELFMDHFPSFPVVPGVLLTEMMAQAAGKCLDAEKKPRGKAMLVRIKSAGFHHWVLPDQEVKIYANIKTNQDNYATAECKIEVESKQACSAELFFGFLTYDHFGPEYRDEILEEYLKDK
jgi:3-hydroxyacyl-[acyl-carrier-protein] dehydratase